MLMAKLRAVPSMPTPRTYEEGRLDGRAESATLIEKLQEEILRESGARMCAIALSAEYKDLANLKGAEAESLRRQLDARPEVRALRLLSWCVVIGSALGTVVGASAVWAWRWM